MEKVTIEKIPFRRRLSFLCTEENVFRKFLNFILDVLQRGYERLDYDFSELEKKKII